MAVEHRNTWNFVSISQRFPDLPFGALAHELLRLPLDAQSGAPVELLGIVPKTCIRNCGGGADASNLRSLQSYWKSCYGNDSAKYRRDARTLLKLLIWLVEYRLWAIREYRERLADDEKEAGGSSTVTGAPHFILRCYFGRLKYLTLTKRNDEKSRYNFISILDFNVKDQHAGFGVGHRRRCRARKNDLYTALGAATDFPMLLWIAPWLLTRHQV